MIEPSASQVIETLELEPLHESCNGYFRETWRDAYSTVIHWLLPRGHFARLHAATHPESFFYHGGAPSRMTLLDSSGQVSRSLLGSDMAAGEVTHLVVPAGTWMATETLGEYTLMSVSVSPPFTPAILIPADAEALCREHPAHADLIRSLS